MRLQLIGNQRGLPDIRPRHVRFVIVERDVEPWVFHAPEYRLPREHLYTIVYTLARARAVVAFVYSST